VGRIVPWPAVASAKAAQRVGESAASPPNHLAPPVEIFRIIFGAVTDAKQRPGFPGGSTFASFHAVRVLIEILVD